MTKSIRRHKRRVGGLALMASVMFVALVMAAGEDFELDGNPKTNGALDWDNLDNPPSGYLVRTNLSGALPNVSDPAGVTLFTQGSKDTLDLPDNTWTNGSVPDKDEILNAFAVAYVNASNELIINFGLDRFANNGDAFMGFWFFQDNISAQPGGSFSGVRQPGDILVLANLDGGGQTATIQVYEWVAGGGDISEHLKLLKNDQTALCGVAGNDTMCAITNVANGTQSAWPFKAKRGAAPQNTYDKTEFFEGKINLTSVFSGAGAEAPCLSSFMAETRASSSVTAQLKDFVLDSFDTCGSISVRKVTKHVDGSILNDGDTIFEYDLEKVGGVVLADDKPLKVGDDPVLHTYERVGTGDFKLSEVELGGKYDPVLTTVECNGVKVTGLSLTFTVTSANQAIACTITNQLPPGTPIVTSIPVVKAQIFDTMKVQLEYPLAPNTQVCGVKIELFAGTDCASTTATRTYDNLCVTFNATGIAETGTLDITPQVSAVNGQEYRWKISYPGDTLNKAAGICGERTKVDWVAVPQ